MYSNEALKIYAAKKAGVIKTNARFWREFNSFEKIKEINSQSEIYESEIKGSGVGLLCAFDKKFPPVPDNLKPSERPYFFAFKGDVSLLDEAAKNVAVVGTTNPDSGVLEREREIVSALVERGYNIVSGLAFGCDTEAHKQCLLNKGKTIAFLPSTLDKIYPKANEKLANEIVANGGLVITEYVTEPSDRYQSIGRFIGRDRLQAMFAGSIILIASYLPKQGDSGSRHAMAKAEEYKIKRFVMYNEATDKDSSLFGLNRLLVQDGVKSLTLGDLDNL